LVLLIAIDHAMDPYQTLGLPKNCTGDELKEAFRARARLVHPDRGGEPEAFIQLRHAYDQIKSDLGRRPPGSTAEASARPVRQDPRPKGPDPNWEPDLILLDPEPTRTRPPAPPDPNWKPDFVLLDDAPLQDHRPGSTETNREPDLILLDDEPRDPRVAWRNYIGWLARISRRSHLEDQVSDETWLKVSAVMVLFSVIILTVWIIFWAAWSNVPPQPDSFEMTPRLQDLSP
jgi:curved DNA-binding protein CbpA